MALSRKFVRFDDVANTNCELAKTVSFNGDFIIRVKFLVPDGTGIYTLLGGADIETRVVVFGSSHATNANRLAVAGQISAGLTGALDGYEGKLVEFFMTRTGSNVSIGINDVELISTVDTDTLEISTVGVYADAVTNPFSGILADVKLTDLDNPSNSLSFDIDSIDYELAKESVFGINQWSDDIQNTFSISSNITVTTNNGLSLYTSNGGTSEYFTRTLPYFSWTGTKVSCEAKAGTSNFLLLRGNGTARAIFNISTGEVVSSTGVVRAYITPTSGGFYFCEIEVLSVAFPSISMSDGTAGFVVTIPAGLTIEVKNPIARELVGNALTYNNFSQDDLINVSYDKGYGWLNNNELVVNGGFDIDSGWSKASGVTIENGKFNTDGTTNGELSRQSFIGINPNTSYKVSMGIELVAGNLGTKLGGGANSYLTSSGKFIEVKNDSTVDNIQLSAINNAVGSIDNVSVKELFPIAYSFNIPKLTGLVTPVVSKITSNITSEIAQ